MNRLFASVRVYAVGAWLSYVALFAWSRPASYIASLIVAPLGYMVFFLVLGTSATGRDTSSFYLVGNALQMAALNGVFGMTMVIGNERNAGTLLYLIGSSANRLVMFLGRASFNILSGFLSVAICFAWATLLGLDLSRANWLGLALAILFVSASTSGLGLWLGSISLVSPNVMFFNNTMFMVLWLFSGANIPLAEMPGWMQAIGYWLPLRRGIQSARLLVSGTSISEVLPFFAGEVGIGFLYALAGYALFRWVEFQARRRGTLEAF